MGFWRIYYGIAKMTATTTFLTNVSSPYWAPRKHEFVDTKKMATEGPLIFTGLCLTKAFFFGSLWPGTLVKTIADPWPVLIPGSSLVQVRDELQEANKE